MSDEAKHHRNPNCPKESLEQAISRAKTFYDAAGKAKMKPAGVATALGYTSLNGTALTAVGVLNQYGLLDKDDAGNLSISSEAVALLHPKSDEQKLDLLRKSAQKPKVFSDLLTNGFDKCNETVLSNHLIQNGFTPDSAKKVAFVFKENIEFAKLSSDGIMSKNEVKKHDSNPSKVNSLTEVIDHAIRNPPPGAEHASLPFLAGNTQLNKVLATYSIPLGTNVATLTFSGDRLTPDDFDALGEYVELFKKQFERKLSAVAAPTKDQKTIPFPRNAMWKAKDSNRPVKLVGLMGEREGQRYFKSEDGTGIPESELEF